MIMGNVSIESNRKLNSKRTDAGFICVSDGPSEVLDYLVGMINEQHHKEMSRQYLPGCKVRFTGNVHELASMIGGNDALREAKAVMYDGGIGEVLGSDEFSNEGVAYMVDFESGMYVILESYLERV